MFEDIQTLKNEVVPDKVLQGDPIRKTWKHVNDEDCQIESLTQWFLFHFSIPKMLLTMHIYGDDGKR